MGLQVSGLSKLFSTPFKGADIRAISSVDSHVSAKVEIK